MDTEVTEDTTAHDSTHSTRSRNTSCYCYHQLGSNRSVPTGYGLTAPATANFPQPPSPVPGSNFRLFFVKGLPLIKSRMAMWRGSLFHDEVTSHLRRGLLWMALPEGVVVTAKQSGWLPPGPGREDSGKTGQGLKDTPRNTSAGRGSYKGPEGKERSQ